jgi:hypothetical protein
VQEDFLQFVWQHRHFAQYDLLTANNESVEVVNTGSLNADSGPDFFNACVRIDDTRWWGNVEVHTVASDWYKHGHHVDEAYNNVVLHVVAKHDKDCYTCQGRLLPTLTLPFDEQVWLRYEHLMQMNTWVACSDYLHYLDKLLIQNWIESLVVERLEQKTGQWRELFASVDNHLEEAFYIHLVRSLGTNTNALPFEMLARATPLNLLARQRNNLLQLEAMLFGQAGMLDQPDGDAYYIQLRREYQHLRAKYKLVPIEGHLWKFMRLRPVNFPTIRLAQLAVLLFHSTRLIDKILEASSLEDYLSLFDLATSDYWNTHYRFMKSSAFRKKHMGEGMIRSLLINTVIPFLFMYASHMGSQQYRDKAFDLLQELPPEDNQIVRGWQKLHVTVPSAMESQGLIQLKKHYCNQKKCLSCRIGKKLVTVIGKQD